MRKVVIFIYGFILSANMGFSQQKFGTDSIQTIANASIYSEYVKHGNFKEALPAWRYVFFNAPQFQLNTYIRGEMIIDNIYRLTSNKAYIDTLMMVYDQWIKYYGNHPKFGEAFVLGLKGNKLYQLKGNDPEVAKEAFAYLSKSIDLAKTASHPATIKATMQVSCALLKENQLNREELVNVYNKLSQYAGTTNTKEALNGMFFNSGAADCATLEQILGARFQNNQQNKEELTDISRILRRSECTDSELYAKISEASYKIDPNAESAYSLAIMFLKKSDFEKGKRYLKEAIQKAIDNTEKADYLLRLAQIELTQKQLAEAQRNANEAIKINPNLGQAYIVIARAYVEHSREYGKDEFDKASVFWAAVDKLIKAKQVDPQVASDADALIKTYTPHFPSKEEAFYRGIFEGNDIKLESWINVTTKARFNQ